MKKGEVLGKKTNRKKKLIKKIQEKEKIENYPKNLKIIQELPKDPSFSSDFVIFNSINNILTVVYHTKYNSIISYDLKNNQYINEIKVESFENFFKYKYDKKNKMDLLLVDSFSFLKLFNFNTLECIFSINKKSEPFSLSTFLNDNDDIYIIFYHKNNEPSNDIKNNKTELFDLNGKKKEELNFISKDILYLETFYDIKTSKTYIISYNNSEDFIKSYDYNEKKV